MREPRSLGEAIERCPFRSVVSMSSTTGRILAAVALMGKGVDPLDAQAYEDAAYAFSRGGSFLILAETKEARDAAKLELIAWAAGSSGRVAH
jgi:hypothetical protein